MIWLECPRIVNPGGLGCGPPQWHNPHQPPLSEKPDSFTFIFNLIHDEFWICIPWTKFLEKMLRAEKNEYKPIEKYFFLWLADILNKIILFVFTIHIYSIHFLNLLRKERMKRGKWYFNWCRWESYSPSQQWQRKVCTREMMLPLTCFPKP